MANSNCGLSMTSRSLLPCTSTKTTSLNDKLRSLMRGSEIALMRISSPSTSTLVTSSPPSSCPPSTNRTSAPCSSIGVTSNKEDSNTITISITSSTGPAPSSSLGPVTLNGLSGKKSNLKPKDKIIPQLLRTSNPIPEKTKSPPKKKKKVVPKAPSVQQKLIHMRPSKNSPFTTQFEEELVSDVDEDDVQDVKNLPSITNNLPFPTTDLRRLTCDDIDLDQLRTNLTSQKLYLTRWIKVKVRELEDPIPVFKRSIEEERKAQRSSKNHLDLCLEENRSRVSGLESPFRTTPRSIRKGLCCFVNDDDSHCLKPSLPFTRHCRSHILYNVDQTIFERCTVKDASTLTQCSNPTFDIEREEPLCDLHSRKGCDKSSESSETPKNTRRRSKNSTGRRKRKRGGKGSKDISQTMDDPDSMKNGDTMDGEEDVVTPCRAQNNGNELPPIPPALDMALSLPPVDEALVASLVHELPFEAEQTDFNMITDDAFVDIFNEPLKPNPEIESFALKNCITVQPPDPYMFNNCPVQQNGQILQPRAATTQHVGPPEDLASLPSNILDFLTTEQQQQLNGLIDGDLGLTSSPTMKSSPAVNEYVSSVPAYGSIQPIPNNGYPNGLRHHSEIQNPMEVPMYQTYSAYGPRVHLPHQKSTSQVRFACHPGSSVKLSSINDASIQRNHFVKISEVGINSMESHSIISPQINYSGTVKSHPMVRTGSNLHPMVHHHQLPVATTITVGPPVFEENNGS